MKRYLSKKSSEFQENPIQLGLSHKRLMTMWKDTYHMERIKKHSKDSEPEIDVWILRTYLECMYEIWVDDFVVEFCL